ncbi:hypothetical protein [Streptomyces sp. NPDC001635]
MTWPATTPRSSPDRCGPAITELPPPPPSPAPAHHLRRRPRATAENNFKRSCP